MRPGSTELKAIALLCVGMSGADVEKAVREARGNARRKGRALTIADFRDVLDPPERRPSLEMQLRFAAHEAGHAIAALRLDISGDITASIVASQGATGSVYFEPRNAPLTPDLLDRQLTLCLAGRAAEEIVFDEPSGLSGGKDATTDLAQATLLVVTAVTKHGLSKQQGLVWTPGEPERVVAPGSVLAQEVRDRLEKAHARALKLLRDNIGCLERLTKALIERRVLSHQDILRIDRGEGDASDYEAGPVDPKPNPPKPSGLDAFAKPDASVVFDPAYAPQYSPPAPGYAQPPVHQNPWAQHYDPHRYDQGSQHQKVTTPPPSPPDYGQHLHQPHGDPHAPQHGYPPPRQRSERRLARPVFRDEPRDQKK